MKETSDKVKELINTMTPKEVTARCQQAIDKASIHDVSALKINLICLIDLDPVEERHIDLDRP
jgi:hypothetical protein